jgi:hypothetical protein
MGPGSCVVLDSWWSADGFTAARLAAGLSRDDLAARAATIGHRWHTETAPYEEPGPLREDLAEYIDRIEAGRDDEVDLPVTHPYWSWFAEACDVSVLTLIDQPTTSRSSGGTP